MSFLIDPPWLYANGRAYARLSPERAQGPAAAAAGAAKVCLTAYGPAASASNSVNQTEPVGGRPGRWWVV